MRPSGPLARPKISGRLFFKLGSSHLVSVRQARHQAEGDYGLVDVAASSRGVQLIGDMAPGFALTAFGRRARLQRTFALTNYSE
jgi:hypothetical protein